VTRLTMSPRRPIRGAEEVLRWLTESWA
jgi:hypothetical protein